MGSTTQIKLRQVALPFWRWLTKPQGHDFEAKHRELSQQLDYFMTKAKACHCSPSDIDLMVYAMAACADEIIANSDLIYHQSWVSKPLQWLYCQETNAGEGFFHRLDKALATAEPYVLEYYYLALLLGFRGCYARDPDVALNIYRDKLTSAIKQIKPVFSRTNPRAKDSLIMVSNLTWLVGLVFISQLIINSKTIALIGSLG